MSAIKRYIEEQATLIANEYGGNVDDIIYEITSEEKDILREKLRQKFKEDNPHLFQD